ncbi:MAG: hypothetical protein RIF42_02480, partial [Parvibaculaceae bacterium]
MLDFFHEFQAAILAIVVTVTGAVIVRWLQPKARIIWSPFHQFAFRVRSNDPEGGEFLVHTQSIFVQNIGRGAADDVEIYFNFKPQNFEIWPILKYEAETNDDGRFIIRIRNMAPRETFTVEILSTAEPPAIFRVRTRNAVAGQIMMA